MVRPYYALLHYALHSLLEGRWQDQRNSAHQNSMSVADTKYSIYRPPATWSPLRKYKSRWRQSREIDREVTRAKPSSGHLYHLRSCLVSHGAACWNHSQGVTAISCFLCRCVPNILLGYFLFFSEYKNLFLLKSFLFHAALLYQIFSQQT